ncbi:hypothetical protein C3E78_11825 [Aeromicrobium chenweiae]|uniref:DUF4352 domain-containing protein n=1 Tax=Aeromicrobium chenweiae TaxID=2079793 RepID=A0A2S0WNC8_9ACTN|nr:hypothetical protein C3E78_11825 [Aeromicrobium chenweiae]
MAAALVLGGCSSDSEPDEKTKASDAVAVPKGFDVPAGVTLTPGGTKLAQGKPASVVQQVGDRAASAVTVTVARVKKGSMKDFQFFSLDAETKRSTPFYVTVKVKNEGPAGLGGAAVPIFAHDDSNTQLPANDIVGTFKPCPRSTLPKSFLPGASANLCLVYLLPRGRKLVSIDLQPGSAKDAVTWQP